MWKHKYYFSEVNEMKTKLIFNSFLAKQLLHCGHQIKDLLKDHKRENGVVFVFEETEEFTKDLIRLIKE